MLHGRAVMRRAAVDGQIAIDSLTLDHQSRHRRRVRLTTDRGHDVMLDLAETIGMADGDLLDVGGGRYIKIVAAAEPLLAIHAHNPVELARIAWHLGNRHTPAEIGRDAIHIQPDHVLAAMIVGLGGHVHAVERPFQPEGGAYGGHAPTAHHGHGHDHAPGDHGTGHDHGSRHASGHGVDSGDDHPHPHGTT